MTTNPKLLARPNPKCRPSVYVKDTFAAKDKNPISVTVQAPNAEALAIFIEQIVFAPDHDWVQGFAMFQNGQWTLTNQPPVAENNPNFLYYILIFNQSARHTFKEMPTSGALSSLFLLFLFCARTGLCLAVVILDAIHLNWHSKRLRMCVYKWGSNIATAKELTDFMKACVEHGDLHPADVPVKNTVQEVTLRLKQACANVYTGPTAAFRQWAVILLKEPASQLDRLIEESDPPANLRPRLMAISSPKAATLRSIQLAKVTIPSLKKQHEDLRQFGHFW